MGPLGDNVEHRQLQRGDPVVALQRGLEGLDRLVEPHPGHHGLQCLLLHEMVRKRLAKAA
ncbi:hypothetical protein D3C72_2518430 [compost metagenome]